jgi:dolichyl-phosphate-mannose--protein O-mannosyl transferase
MHFAQTRIATIDVYVTFFIIMMFYFMYQYYKSDIDTEHPYKNDFISLALCGCATGLAIASKVTGVYAAVFGLLPLWIIAFCQKYRKYKNINADKTMSDTRGVYTLKTMLWCVLFFVVIPLGIYCLSYIPFLRAPDANGFKSIIENQFDMLRYHGKTVLNSTHPFSSKWYEWILMKRPIWYYSGTISETVKEGISSFGNPLVWWAGVPAFVYMLYLCIAKKDKKALFLVIAYAAQLLPWALVPRLTFIYHYFPCVPFIVLMIGYSISKLYDKARNKKHFFAAVCVYVMLVILLFVMFYPVLSGQPCRVDYVNNFLKWFDSWVLI